MEWAGNALLTAGTDLDGNHFVSEEQVDVSLELTHTDATFEGYFLALQFHL